MSKLTCKKTVGCGLIIRDLVHNRKISENLPVSMPLYISVESMPGDCSEILVSFIPKHVLAFEDQYIYFRSTYTRENMEGFITSSQPGLV